MTGTGFASSFAPVIALALGLAVDATAAAAACGVATPVVRPRHYVTVAAYFGGFQALMPLLGWLLATWIGAAIAAWDHWIAFVLLGGIGAKMILEAWRSSRGAAGDPGAAREPGKAGEPDATRAPARDTFGARLMLGLAVATSLDAFAAGITLPMFQVPIALSIAAIGVITAGASALGLAIGRRLGDRFGTGLDVLGGAVLIGLGTKLLVEHLTA